MNAISTIWSGWANHPKGKLMNTKDQNSGTPSQEMNLAGSEPIKSIEDLLRERGFFDSVKPENKS